VRQLDAWRRIPFHDPGLPAGALPADWPGTAAWALFGELTERLRPLALEHVGARVAPRARAA
jgi:phenylacetic acid degradation operon negative regulatory protein